MSIISSNSIASGLQNATTEQNMDCAKDKLVNNIKHGVVAAGIGLGAGAAIKGLTTAKGQQVVSSIFSKGEKVAEKVADKLGKSNALAGLKEKISKGISNLPETLSKIGQKIKANPKTAIAAGGIAALALIAGTVLQRHNDSTNGKIEAEHQAKADLENGIDA